MRASLIIALLLGVAFGASAQTPLALNDAIALALKNNYDILVSKNDQQIATNNNSWGQAGAYPTIGFNATHFNQYALGDGSHQHTFNPAISLNWTVFSGFRIKTTKQKLEDLASLSETSTQLQIENTIRDVILAYYGSLLERERLAINTQVLALSRDRFRAARLRQELGAAVTFDVLQAQNDYLSDSASYISQRLNFNNSKRFLHFLLSDTTQVEYVLTEEFVAQTETYKLDELLNRARESNSTLQLQRVSLNMAEKDVRIAKSAWMPNLSVNTSIGYNRQKIVVPVTTEFEAYAWTGSVTLAWQLFTGGNRKRTIQNAKINVLSSQTNIDQLAHNLSNQITTELENYEVRKQLYNVSVEAEKSAKLNLQIAKEKFENGTINSFNYRDVQTLYLNVAQGRLISIFNLMNSKVELMRAIGEIVK